MDRLWNELRLTVRALAKAPGFAAAVIATLSVALALETTIVSVVNAYLVRSLPYPASTRLYQVLYAPPEQPWPRGLEKLDWSSLSDVIEHPISWDLDMFYLQGGEHSEQAPGAWVTPGFMQGLGIRPAIGRAFLPEEFRAGGAQPAGFWHLNPYTKVLTPLRAPSYPYMVRLRENVPPALAAQRISDLVRGGASTLPEGWRAELKSTHTEYARSIRPLLLAIGSAVTIVLLIAVCNVTLLVLLRGVRRQKEIAVRLALGASNSHIARLLVTESLVLCTTAAVIGGAIAMAVNRWLGPTIELQLGRRVPGGVSAVSIDARVVAALAALTLVIAATMSLVPMFAASRRTLFNTLRSSRANTADGPRGSRARSILIVVEVAGSFALLVGGGLMIQTTRQMLDVDLGIQPAAVVEAGVALRDQSYPTLDSRAVFYERLVNELRRASGVAAAALASPSSLTSNEPRPLETDDANPVTQRAALRGVSAGYFATIGARVVQGREFRESDRRGTESVALVSERLARALWPNASPIGRRLRMVDRDPLSNDSITVIRTVVGVARDVRQTPLDDQLADVYIPLVQSPGRFVTMVVKGSGAPADWATTLRAVVKTIDAEITVNTPQVLTTVVDARFARPRFLASMFSGFGFFAAFLGVMGLYAVVSYAAKQREHEIAVRMAVGADAGSILKLFLRDAGVVLAAGIGAGVLAATGVGKLLATQLFGVGRIDAATLVAAAVALSVACLLAVWRPARRAGRIDPATALRAE
jgi:putative ABC transport system permease protein